MADETGEDGARAARMDEWVVWEAEKVAPEGRSGYFFLLSFYASVKGTHYPETCAQCDAKGGGFLMLWSADRLSLFLRLSLSYIPLRNERLFNEIQINK